jgi:molecular chaperone Hsp33
MTRPAIYSAASYCSVPGCAACWFSSVTRGRPCNPAAPIRTALRDLLGEILAAAPLCLPDTSKVEGRLIDTDAWSRFALRTLVCRVHGRQAALRGLARWQAHLTADAAGSKPFRYAMRCWSITIEGEARPGPRTATLSGTWSVCKRTLHLQSAFEDYFTQSEQLPTRILLAADGDHACGIMLQHLPGASDDPEAWQSSACTARYVDPRGAADLAC